MFIKSPDADRSIFEFRLGGSTRYFSLPVTGTAGTTTTLGANGMRAVPIFIAQNFKADRIAINVTTLASGNARLGIYEDNGKTYPGKLLLDAGEVATGTTGVKELTISKWLQGRKLYWLVIATSAGPTVRGLALSSCLSTYYGNNSVLGANAGHHLWVSFTYAVLPSTFPAGATVQASSVPPGVFLRKENY